SLRYRGTSCAQATQRDTSNFALFRLPGNSSAALGSGGVSFLLGLWSAAKNPLKETRKLIQNQLHNGQLGVGLCEWKEVWKAKKQQKGGGWVLLPAVFISRRGFWRYGSPWVPANNA